MNHSLTYWRHQTSLNPCKDIAADAVLLAVDRIHVNCDGGKGNRSFDEIDVIDLACLQSFGGNPSLSVGKNDGLIPELVESCW